MFEDEFWPANVPDVDVPTDVVNVVDVPVDVVNVVVVPTDVVHVPNDVVNIVDVPANATLTDVTNSRFVLPTLEKYVTLNGERIVTYPFLADPSPKDLALLRMIHEYRPYARGHKEVEKAWEELHMQCALPNQLGESLLMGIKLSTIKSRFKRYMEIQAARDANVPIRSGQDDERMRTSEEQVLEEIFEDWKAFKKGKNQKRTDTLLAAKEANVAASIVRDVAMGNMVARDVAAAFAATTVADDDDDDSVGIGLCALAVGGQVATPVLPAKRPFVATQSTTTKRFQMNRVDAMMTAQDNDFGRRNVQADDHIAFMREQAASDREQREADRKQREQELDLKRLQWDAAQESARADRESAREERELLRLQLNQQHTMFMQALVKKTKK